MMIRATRAEILLQSLGIDEPADIDLEAIAWHVGAKIKIRPLVNCEARIIGLDDKAIITVNATSSPERRRFSIGHELGHWAHHRGQCAVCRSIDIGNFRNDQAVKERAADAYAADLLMPWYLFKPAVRGYKRLDIKSLREVAGTFSASLTATLIRMIDSDNFPCSMIVTHRASGKPWVTRAPSMGRRWFAREELDPDSFAFSLMYGNDARTEGFPRKIGADAWFDHHSAAEFEITEQSFKLPTGDVVTILNLPERMAS
jgi:hypothetical protein